MADNKIKIEREEYEKNGKTYSAYYIKGELRGTEVKAQVIPPDVGGYKLMDVVFNGGDEAELQLTPYKFTTDDGQVLEGNTFKAVSYDEDGVIYECPVKPARQSDKAILTALLRG